MTSGFLLSHTIPASSNISDRVSSRPGFRRILSWLPREDGDVGVMIWNAGLEDEVEERRRNSR
jgi:hypothetical protein